MAQTPGGSPYAAGSDPVTSWPEQSKVLAERVDAIDAKHNLNNAIQNQAIDALEAKSMEPWGTGLAVPSPGGKTQLAAVAQATGESVELSVDGHRAYLTTGLRRGQVPGGAIDGRQVMTVIHHTDGTAYVYGFGRWFISNHDWTRSIPADDPLTLCRSVRDETPMLDIGAAVETLAAEIAVLRARIEQLESP